MKSSEGNTIRRTEKSRYQRDQRKHNIIKTPDIQKMQEVIIDNRTKVYIALDADPEEARKRYFNRLEAKGKVFFAGKKPVVSG